MKKFVMISHNADYTNQIEDMFSALDLELVLYMIEISLLGELAL